MKTLIFDFYGTLAYPSKPTHPYHQLFRNFSDKGISYRAFTELVMTQNFGSLAEMATSLGISEQNFEQLEHALIQEVQSVILFEEVAEVLEELSKQTDLYLLSNLATPYKSPFYILGLDEWIKQPFFSCDMGFIKPQAAAFEHVLFAINKTPDEVIMIGDSLNADFLGAKKHGMEAIWLQRNQRKGEITIQSLEELL